MNRAYTNKIIRVPYENRSYGRQITMKRYQFWYKSRSINFPYIFMVYSTNMFTLYEVIYKVAQMGFGKPKASRWVTIRSNEQRTPITQHRPKNDWWIPVMVWLSAYEIQKNIPLNAFRHNNWQRQNRNRNRNKTKRNVNLTTVMNWLTVCVKRDESSPPQNVYVHIRTIS